MKTVLWRLAWVIPVALCVELAYARQDVVSNDQPAIYTGEENVLTIALSAKRHTYYVGEPLRLTLAVRNEGEKRLVGFFAPVGGRAEIHWRRPGRSFARFIGGTKDHDGRRAGINIARAPVILEGHQGHSSKITLAMHGDGRLVLEEPGEYEFKGIVHPAPKDPDHSLESNVVGVRVEPVADSQREAFAEYSRNRLGALVQSAGSVAEKHPATVISAADFLDRYPQSLYAQDVRKELVRALRVRVSQNRASKEERGIYEKLREGEPPAQ